MKVDEWLDGENYSSQSFSAGLDQSLNMGWRGPVVLRPVSVYDVTMLAQDSDAKWVAMVRK